MSTSDVLIVIASCERLLYHLQNLPWDFSTLPQDLSNVIDSIEVDRYFLTILWTLFSIHGNKITADDWTNCCSHFQRLQCSLRKIAKVSGYFVNGWFQANYFPKLKQDALSVQTGMHDCFQDLSTTLAFLPSSFKEELMSISTVPTVSSPSLSGPPPPPQRQPIYHEVIATVASQLAIQKIVNDLRKLFASNRIHQEDPAAELAPGSFRTKPSSNHGIQDIWAKTPVPDFQTYFREMVHSDRSLVVILEKEDIREEITKLINVLQNVFPATMHLLRALGLRQSTENHLHRFGILYELPRQDLRMHSLFEMIRFCGSEGVSYERKPKHSLSERAHIAREIVTAVLHLHALGWAHQSIRSSSVLITFKEQPVDPDYASKQDTPSLNPELVGPAYLVGFTFSLRASSHIVCKHDARWEHELYLHPDKLASATDREEGEITEVEPLHARILHDAYSLGVVLLELGFWTLYKDCADLQNQTSPADRRNWFIERARKDLPTVMGSIYAKAALTCLEDTFQGGLEEVLDQLADIKL